MIGMIGQRRKGHRELAAFHVGLEIFASHEYALIIAGAKAGHIGAIGRIAMRTPLRGKHGVENDFGVLRDDDVVLLIDVGEKALEMLGREARPEESESNADTRF